VGEFWDEIGCSIDQVFVIEGVIEHRADQFQSSKEKNTKMLKILVDSSIHILVKAEKYLIGEIWVWCKSRV
jgi:hypothetical protein